MSDTPPDFLEAAKQHLKDARVLIGEDIEAPPKPPSLDELTKQLQDYSERHEAAKKVFYAKPREERIDRGPWVVSREGWEKGPWDLEPDRIDWVHRGFHCLIIRTDISGGLCGYVGLPKSHPWYGVNQNRIPWKLISVHGGLTYSALDQGPIWCDAEEDLWWLGFDCGHANDFSPALRATLRKAYARQGDALPEHLQPRTVSPFEPADYEPFRETYRTMFYVKIEVENLVAQCIRGESRYWRIHRAKRRDRLFLRGSKKQIKERMRLRGRRSKFTYGRR